MKVVKCNSCKKEKEIILKKPRLCENCYTHLILSDDPQSSLTFSKPIPSEVMFIKNYFRHKKWSYQPATFKLGKTNYRPDFYDCKTKTFIEVIGTRQVYHQNKHKYKLLRKIHPEINFEIRKVDGSLLLEGDRINWK